MKNNTFSVKVKTAKPNWYRSSRFHFFRKNNYYALIIFVFLISCSGNTKTSSLKPINKFTPKEITKPEFQSIIDSANVNGAILVYDLQKNRYYSNNFNWSKKGHLPASTFKIANSIIALETGVIENDTTLFKWNGEKRAVKAWEQDLILKDAFQFSCVPCYQEVARKIGVERMNEYLQKLNYGDIEVNSTNIDNFWLEGNSNISQFQQIDFLKRLYQSELPIKTRTEAIIKKLMFIEEMGDFKLMGKTGWSVRNGNNNGWFVGYIENNGTVYFFASNVEPKETFNMNLFSMIRKDVTNKALQLFLEPK